MAELASVKDIGPQYAELLERSGVHTINQLKNYDTTELLNIVRAKENSLKINIQGNTPGPALVENWIAEARDHTFTNPEEGQTA
jgi:predicted flap endonuclease-1-like 5' DNA nuclease